MADNGHAPVDVDKELGEPSSEVVHKPIRHNAQGGLDVLRELAVVVFLRWAHSDNGDWYNTYSMVIGLWGDLRMSSCTLSIRHCPITARCTVHVMLPPPPITVTPPLAPPPHTLLRMALKRSRTELPWYVRNLRRSTD